MRAGFDLRAADLASRRIQLVAKDDADKVAAVKLAQRDLLAEKTEALAELEAAPSRIAAGEAHFVVHALAVPATSSDEINQYDERVDQDRRADRRRLGGGAGSGRAGREQARPLPAWPASPTPPASTSLPSCRTEGYGASK